MTFTSEAEFARHHEVSRQAVAKWKRAGYLVMREDLVAVEESDRRLQQESLGRFNFRREARGQRGERRPERVALPLAYIAQRVTAMDWQRPFDAETLDTRVREAARCVGLKAERGDPRWRLIDPGCLADPVRGGMNFEWSAEQVLAACRDEVWPEPYDDPGQTWLVVPALLWTLAHPFSLEDMEYR